MDSTLPRLLPPLPSLRHQHRPHHPNTVPRRRDGPGGGSSRMLPAVRVKTGRRGRDAGRFRAQGLFGDGGGGDGLRTVMRMVKLNSAIQNRSVRELLELLGDECLYFFGNLRSVDVPQLGKVKRAEIFVWGFPTAQSKVLLSEAKTKPKSMKPKPFRLEDEATKTWFSGFSIFREV